MLELPNGAVQHSNVRPVVLLVPFGTTPAAAADRNFTSSTSPPQLTRQMKCAPPLSSPAAQGRYTGSTGQTYCTGTCPAGSYCPAGSTTYYSCSSGRYSAAGECSPASARFRLVPPHALGRSQRQLDLPQFLCACPGFPAAGSCTYCAAGKYAASSTSSSCAACPGVSRAACKHCFKPHKEASTFFSFLSWIDFCDPHFAFISAPRENIASAELQRRCLAQRCVCSRLETDSA